MRRRISCFALGPAAILTLAACTPDQSVLHPAGEDAADVARLFWVMAAGAVAIWLIVFGAAVYAVVGTRRPQSERAASLVILGGGVIFPTVTLAALLIYGLQLLPAWGADTPPDVRVAVRAEQYWWRVTYEANGQTVETANEVVLPAGAVVDVTLTSPDVIHSFWIPPLAGKMDAIPGRENLLRLRPVTPGVYSGICAEFCGAGHAMMAFDAIILAPGDYAARIAAEARPATGDPAPFLDAGCGACHRIRGLVEQGSVGPDLTHVAARGSVAGVLDNTRANLRAWIANPQAFKPDARMPAYGMLPEADMDALLDFLEGLR